MEYKKENSRAHSACPHSPESLLHPESFQEYSDRPDATACLPSVEAWSDRS